MIVRIGAGVPAEHVLQGGADLAHRRPRSCRLDRRLEQVGVGIVAAGAAGEGARRVAQRRQRVVARGLVALGAQGAQLGDLLGAHRRVVDLEHLDFVGVSGRNSLTPTTG